MNNAIRLMFMTKHNSMTNAFKVYRRYVIDAIFPMPGAHFYITIELSLSTLNRPYSIEQIPILWEGWTWGQSNLRIRAMGRRFFATLMKVWFERILIADDLRPESKHKVNDNKNNDD